MTWRTRDTRPMFANAQDRTPISLKPRAPWVEFLFVAEAHGVRGVESIEAAGRR